jgi:hypothetical protein
LPAILDRFSKKVNLSYPASFIFGNSRRNVEATFRLSEGRNTRYAHLCSASKTTKGNVESIIALIWRPTHDDPKCSSKKGDCELAIDFKYTKILYFLLENGS